MGIGERTLDRGFGILVQTVVRDCDRSQSERFQSEYGFLLARLRPDAATEGADEVGNTAVQRIGYVMAIKYANVRREALLPSFGAAALAVGEFLDAVA